MLSASPASGAQNSASWSDASSCPGENQSENASSVSLANNVLGLADSPRATTLMTERTANATA